MEELSNLIPNALPTPPTPQVPGDLNTFDMNPEPTPEQTFEVGDTTAPTLLPDDIVDSRVMKAHYGLSGILDKTAEELRASISGGKEKDLRTEVATTLDNAKQQDIQNKINNVLNTPNTGDPTSPIVDTALIDQVQTLAKSYKPSDPSSVLEDVFSVKYVNQIYTVNSNPQAPKFPWLQDMLSIMPSDMQDNTDLATEAVSKHQYSVQMQEAAKVARENQPWLSPVDKYGVATQTSKVASYIRSALLLYPEFKLRGQVPNTEYFEGGLLGSNLEYQRKVLYSLPYDQYKTVYKTIMDNLIESDPFLAETFSEAMTGHTVNQQVLMDVFSAMSPFEATAIAKLGVVAGKAMVNQTRTSMVNVIRASENFKLQNPDVVAAAGVGDLAEAAVKKSSFQKLKEYQGLNTFDKDAVEALTDNYRVDRQSYTSGPGRFGQSMVNTLDKIYEAGENSLVRAISMMQRVNRTPLPVTTENTIRMVQENIKNELKGIDNAVLNVSEPNYSQIANGYFYEAKIGTPSMEFFKDRQVALNNARLNGIVVNTLPEGTPVKMNPSVKITGGKTNIIDTPQAKPSNANLPVKDAFEIKNDDSGLGWYINVRKFYPETSDVIRDGLISREYDTIKAYREAARQSVVSSLSPTWFNKYLNSSLGWVRTGEETLSSAENVQRKIATHSQAVLLKAAKEITEPLTALPNKYHKDFVRILEAGQSKIDPATGAAGYTFKSPAELEGFYQLHLKRMPEMPEVAAYFSWKSANEADLSLRRMAVYRNESRNGVELHQFSIPAPEGRSSSGFFKGIRQKDFPGGTDTIMVLGNQKGKEAIYAGDKVPPRVAERLKEQVKKGEKIVTRVWNPEEFPFKEWSDKTADARVRYVISDAVETKPLSWDNIPRRGGGHLIPDYDHYIKQAIVHREVINAKGKAPTISDWYHGDRTVMPIQIRAMGENIAKHMNEVRLLLRKGSEDAAKNYSNKHLPFDWEEHRGWYNESRGPEGKKIPAFLDMNQEIRVVPKDKMIAHIDDRLKKQYEFKSGDQEIGNTFKDGTRQGSDARLSQVEFTGQRDVHELYTMEAKGSSKNPIYSYVPGRYLDPITAMDRSLAKIINSTMMDDMKIFSVEHWLRQAAKHLDASESELRAAPFHHFNNPKFLDGTPLEEKLLLLNNWKKARDFLGTPSVVDQWANSASQKLADSIYGATGSTKLAVLPLNYIPKGSKPVDIVRSYAFNMKQGLFSVKTFFSQAATFTNIWAISPRHAPTATMSTALYAVSRYARSPEMLEHLDKMASQIGRGTPDFLQVKFKPGEFTEFVQAIDRSGFGIVGHEHAFLDTPVSMDLFSNRAQGWWQNVRDAGRIPFDLGSQSTRVGAYATAFLEWKSANPLKAMTREAEASVLERASLLDHNMSRASNSPLHTGIMSVPMQFQAYSLRLSEMLTGKRLTPGEKSRLFASSSLLYGIPVGTVGSVGLPMTDDIRQSMLKTGVPFQTMFGVPVGEMAKSAGITPYVPGKNLLDTLAMEGGLSVLSAFIQGGGDFRKGTLMNYSKFGTKGLEILDNALAADKTFLDVAGGVSYNTLKTMGTASAGMLMAAKSWLSPEDKSNPKTFPVMWEDVHDILKEIASVNDFSRGVAAVSASKWIGKNGQFLADTTPTEGSYMAFMGLAPQSVLDSYDMNKFLSEQRRQERAASNIFVKEYLRGVEADNNNDREGAKKHFIRATAALDAVDFPMDKRTELLSVANRGRESQVSRVQWNFYIKDNEGRVNNIDPAMKAFKSIQELKNK